MKMTKKIILAASALMALAFTGCSDLFHKKIGEENILKYSNAEYDDGMGTWTVKNYENKSEGYKRNVNLLTTKHSDMVVVATITPDESKYGPGVIGAIFNLTEEKRDILDEEGNPTGKKEKYYNFSIVGVRQNDYYISHFCNIKESELNADNFGARDSTTKKDITRDSYDSTIKTPYEIVIEPTQTKPIKPFSELENKDKQVVIQIIEDETTGDYEINLYENDVYDSDAHTLVGDIDDPAPIATSSIDAEIIGKEGPEQALVGAYVCVYGKQTLNASIELLDLTNNAIVVE